MTTVVLDAGYCTLAFTVETAFNVNVQLLVLLPPLEHAPDQIAARLFVTVSVTEAPAVNDAEPLLRYDSRLPSPVAADVTRGAIGFVRR